jgi:hypothetical protein
MLKQFFSLVIYHYMSRDNKYGPIYLADVSLHAEGLRAIAQVHPGHSGLILYFAQDASLLY